MNPHTGERAQPESFAIINVYTAGYSRFFRPFYESVKKHFFVGHPKTFFIFTDNAYIQEPDLVNISVDPKGFRHHHVFKQIEAASQELSQWDHIVFFNGNALILQSIGLGVHPEDTIFLSPLFGATTGLAHNAYKDVDTNPASSAYINPDTEDISIYWRGGLWGGQSKRVLPMIKQLSSMVERYPHSHCEAYINRYFVTHKREVECLDHRYTWPGGGWGNNPYFDIRIVMIDKQMKYDELRNYPLSDEKARLYAKKLNVDGPLYLGKGVWKSDVVEVTPVPPATFLESGQKPFSEHTRGISQKIKDALKWFIPPAVLFVYRYALKTLPCTNKFFRWVFMMIQKPFLEEITRRNLKAPFWPHYLKNYKLFFFHNLVGKSQYKTIGFSMVAVETDTVCNRKCDFCFQAERFPQKPARHIAEATWRKIIDELAELKFCGVLYPFLYNEPLLDKNLPRLIAYARQKCPLMYIQLNSNGDLLTEKVLKELIACGMNNIFVTNYDDEEKPRLNELVRKYPARVGMRSHRDFKKLNRAGRLFKEDRIFTSPCLKPSYMLVINWQGDVVLCCQDNYGEYRFGNVNEDQLINIWHSDKFKQYRAIIGSNRRAEIEFCKHCNATSSIMNG